MGCFNLRCAVTNVPLCVGTPVALFRMGTHQGRPQRVTGDNYMFCSMPVFGEYDDYGGIENVTDMGWDDINTAVANKARDMKFIVSVEDDDRWLDEAMFIYRPVYDELVKHDMDAGKSWREGFKTMGEWRKHRIAEVRERIAKYSYPRETSSSQSDLLFAELMRTELHKNEMRELYFMNDSETYIWNDIVYENPEIGELYVKYIAPLNRSSWVHQWEPRPSGYAGQETDHDEIIKIREIGLDYLRDQKRRWDRDFGEEDES